MRIRFLFSILLVWLISACSGPNAMNLEKPPLEGLRITIDAGHGASAAYDNFRVGPTGEREEWINLRVARILARKLRRAGADVYMTRNTDEDVSLGGRAALAKRHKSDLLVSIHHNGSGNDPDMDVPIVYFYGPANLNPAAVDFAQILLKNMRAKLSFEQPDAGAVYSDHLIYNSGTSILRNTIDEMPGVIGEGGFFTNAKGEARLKSRQYNEREALVYFNSILNYYERGLPGAEPLVEDSLDYLDLNRELGFQLDDGFGSSFFEEHSFMVLQDGDTLPSRWDIHEGILYAQPIPSTKNQISFQVFGRNFKGNALHPKPFTFTTEQGYQWFTESTWWAAYEQGEKAFTQLESGRDEERLDLVETALKYYQLSLELQIVHPKARLAEEAILVLLIMKEDLTGESLAQEIADQTARLRAYYPE